MSVMVIPLLWFSLEHVRQIWLVRYEEEVWRE